MDVVGELRAGLDGRYVGVDEDGVDAFLLERLQALAPRVVELPCLPDLDGTAPYDEDLVYALTLRISAPLAYFPFMASTNLSKTKTVS